jgi:cyclase
VVGIDVRREASGQYQVYVEGGSRATGLDPLTYARRAEDAGAGEIILQAIDREGTYTGYDLPLIKSVAETVQIPVVALGGARDVNDLAAAIHQGGAAAAAAGSMFVFFGRLRAILINTPDASTRAEAFARAQREATIKTQESFPQ